MLEATVWGFITAAITFALSTLTVRRRRVLKAVLWSLAAACAVGAGISTAVWLRSSGAESAPATAINNSGPVSAADGSVGQQSAQSITNNFNAPAAPAPRVPAAAPSTAVDAPKPKLSPPPKKKPVAPRPAQLLPDSTRAVPPVAPPACLWGTAVCNSGEGNSVTDVHAYGYQNCVSNPGSHNQTSGVECNNKDSAQSPPR